MTHQQKIEEVKEKLYDKFAEEYSPAGSETEDMNGVFAREDIKMEELELFFEQTYNQTRQDTIAEAIEVLTDEEIVFCDHDEEYKKRCSCQHKNEALKEAIQALKDLNI